MSAIMSKNQTRFYEKLIRSYRFQKEATFGSYRNRKGLPQGFVFKQRNLSPPGIDPRISRSPQLTSLKPELTKYSFAFFFLFFSAAKQCCTNLQKAKISTMFHSRFLWHVSSCLTWFAPVKLLVS